MKGNPRENGAPRGLGADAPITKRDRGDLFAIVWDAKTLDQYLANPTAKVPGTRMVVKVAEPARRAALIAYLKAQTK